VTEKGEVMTIKWKSALPVALSICSLGVLVLSQVAGASHPRPQAASPLRLSLVPAFKQCTSPNRTHGSPLAFPSCNPPAQASNSLTVGTPDANGAGAHSVGSVTLKVKVTSPEDVLITLTITDVRCMPGTSSSVCNSANSADGPDYSGELQGNGTIRISDHYNGPGLNEAATVVDIPFPVSAPCSNTADPSTGGVCTVTASSCGQPPDICSVKDGERAVVELTQFQVFDGGSDGQVSTTGDNTLFAVQGLFIP
jgi:hypothetical protein